MISERPERMRLAEHLDWRWLGKDPDALGMVYYGFGLKQAEIGQRSGVSQAMVSKTLNKWGIGKRVSFEEEGELIQAACERWGRYDLAAQELNKSSQWLWKARKEHRTPDLPKSRKSTRIKMTEGMDQQAALLYRHEQMSTAEIARYLEEMFGVRVARETVRCHLAMRGVLRPRIIALKEHFKQRRQNRHQLIRQRDVSIFEGVSNDGAEGQREIPREIIGGDERSLGWETMVVSQSDIRVRCKDEEKFNRVCHNPWEFLGE